MADLLPWYQGLMGSQGAWALAGIVLGYFLGRLQARNAQTEHQLPHQHPIPPEPPPELSEAVQRLIRGNNLIGAIKQLRKETGLGLKEAKDAVEAWRRVNP